MGSNKQVSKFSKKNRLLLTILISSIAVVFSFLAVLLYINYYARVSVVLTTITRYKDGDIKNVSEFDILTVKKGRSITTFPEPVFEGYSFGGWYFDKECNEPYDYTTVLDENLQIYGQLNLLEYSIELVLDDGLKVTNNITQEYGYTNKLTIEDIIKLPRFDDTISLNNGTETTISDYKLLNKEGYTFEGWGFSSTSTDTVTFDYRMNPQNITFYAIWKPIQVELRYCTLDLSFAKNSPQSGFVEDRINGNTGGVMYNSYYNVYVSETLDYGTKVRNVIDPVDEFSNFVFTGWYLDPEFTIPVKFSQLYIRNGYFSLTREHNTNVLKDPLYFDDGHIVDDDTYNRILQYASNDESNSYINVFAKWELKKYTVRYHLNLPEGESYIDTGLMTSIINPGVGRYVYSDNANTIKENNNVHQGKNLVSNYFNAGVLYDEDYFKNVVYIKNDLTGLPLYTLNGWNSKKDGSGYDASNTRDNYFDKSKFDIIDDVITIYAQWTSYYRINYYLTDGSMGDSVLLSTINIESSKVEMPSLNSLVVDITDRKVTFTEQQKIANEAYVNMSQDYFTPLNKTFVGWVNDYSYAINSMPLYIEGIRYNVGTEVDREAGIYLNEPVRNLYTAWVDNVNTYSYDLGEEGLEKADFSKNSLSLSLESRIITSENGVKSYRQYVYDKTNSDMTLLTIYNEQFLITKYLDSKLYSLNGWKLKDGSRIEGNTSQEIKFDRTSRYIKYITNSEPDLNSFKEVYTGVYYDGQVNIENQNYYTLYNDAEDRSYIVLKAKNVTKLVFEAVWIKNIVLTYNAGVDDAVWADGYTADNLSNTAGGNVYMQLSDPSGILTRPCYKFYGWSTINREGDDIINFNTFESENTIYKPKDRYDLFEDDTELFAVWQPIVYTVNIFQKSVDSPTNASSGRIYVSKECFVYNRNEVTNCITIEGNVLKYVNVSGNTITLTMTTSAVAGYGLSDWSNLSGTPLVKDNGIYTITPTDDVNNLFEKFPASDYNSINIYPVFSILKFDIVFNLLGNGIDETSIAETKVSYEDVIYGTNLKNLLPKVYYNYYEDGYTFKGWNISGDVDSRGNIKDDYIANISSSNIIVKSDLVITLIAEKLSYTIKIIFNSPAGETKEIINYQLNHYDSLSELNDEIEAELEKNQYVGYNFSHWQTTIGGMTTNLTQENFADIKVTTPLELYSKYTKAKVVVVFNYESDGELVKVEKESEFMSSFSLNISGFEKQPSKDNYVLKGWALDETEQTEYFRLNSSFVISESAVGSKLVRPDGADYYVLNIYAKWVESLTLAFDTSQVNIAYTDFPTELHYEKGSTIFFKDIPYIAALSNDTISQKSGLGEYSGIWVDQSNREYNVTTTSSFITLSADTTLKPKFTPKNFSITYNYFYLGEYYTINEITKTVNEQYTDAPQLLTKSELDTRLATITSLSSYRATGYYLTKNAFENLDENYRFELGAEFDFVNNASYLTKAKNSKFEFYIILQEMTSLTYYTDRNIESAISPALKFDKGLTHIIGDTNGDGVVNTSDYTPTKTGFEFIGWNSSLSIDYVQYDTGDTILTGVVQHLYPVWEALPLILEYRDENNNLLAMRDDLFTNDIVTLRNFTREGSELTGWAVTLGGAVVYTSGTSLTISDALASLVLESGVYYLRLYSVWEVASYVVSFDVYSALGSKSTMYGKLDGTISSTYSEQIYDSSTLVNFTFPTTASTYELGGQKYKFTGKWTDGLAQYTTTTVNITFVKNYSFSPIYEKVHTLTFVNGTDEIFKLEDVVDGSLFSFNNANLLTTTAAYNTNLSATGSKVIAYSNGGNNYTSSSSININSSLTFTAVVTDLVNVVIYKDLNYVGSEFSFTNYVSLYSVELTSSINLNDYLTTMSGCSTVGFVVSTDMSYTYIPNPAVTIKGNYAIASSGAGKGATVYFYPVLETTIKYYVNNLLSDSETVRLGNYPTKTEISDGEGEYYTGWKLGSSSGMDYVSAPVTGPLDLYTISRPYLQLMVSTTDSYIANSNALVIDGKKPTDSFALPTADEVELRESSKYTITGWYISYQRSYVMDGATGNRKGYSLGQTIKLQDIITALGLPDELSEVSFEMSPIIAFNLKTLSVKNSDNISYNFDISLTVSTSGLTTAEIESLKNSFIVENDGYAFYLLNESTILVDENNDTISFVAYLQNSGKVVLTNNLPTTATITVSKTIDAGYASEGWYYYDRNELIVDGTRISADTAIKAQTAVAEVIQLSINLIFKAESETEITSSNINGYDEYFYIDSDSKYAQLIETSYGNIVNFDVIISEGYEFVELRNSLGNSINASISSSGTRNTFAYEVTNESQIYVVIKKSETYKPSISINTEAITDYDASKISSASTMYITYKEDAVGGSWSNLLKNATEYKLNWSEFSNGYQYINSVAVNNYIQIYTSLNSEYYYVDTINVYNDGSLLNSDGGNNSVSNNQITTGIQVTGVLEIELVLKQRTYSINYYNGSNSLVNGSVTNVAESINIELPTITKEGYILDGYKLLNGTTASDVEFVEYLTNGKTYSLGELQKYTTSRNESNQNSYILLQPVWINNNYKVSITSDYGYFLVNDSETDSVEIDVPYNETLTLNKTVTTGVIVSNSLTFVTKVYSVDTNGNIQVFSSNVEIVFVPFGTWNFVEGYNYNTTSLLSDSYVVVNDVEFSPKVEKGEGLITISINDANNVNANLSVGNVVITDNSVDININLSYDENSELQIDEFMFETQDDCSVTINLNPSFSVDSYDIVIDGKKLSSYANLEAFIGEFNGLNISVVDNVITLNDLVYSIEIIYNLSRADYNSYIQVVSATAGSDLENVYNELTANSTSIVGVGAVETLVGTRTLIDSQELRISSTYTLTFNTNYFELERIYYIDNSNEYTIFGDVVDECLSSFDPLSNELTIVYGGVAGNDITFYVELTLKTMDVIFHSVNDVYVSTDDYSSYNSSLITPNETLGYQYGTTITLSDSSLFKPTTITYNGSQLEFVGWTYYDGNYEKDLANDVVDDTKFMEFTTISWVCSATNGNLHIFSNWSKLFKVSFIPSNDGIESTQDNLPDSESNMSLSDEIAFTLATRNGFDFAGYSFIYDGARYYLRYNGTSFTALEDESGVVTTIESFNASQITLAQVVTADMVSLETAFHEINFEPIWTRNSLTLTIGNDTNKGIVENYKYNGSEYVLGNFNVQYYNTIEVGTIELESITYNCVYVIENNTIIGAIVVKPKTENYYKFGQFQIDGNVVTLPVVLDEPTTINVVYSADYVPHTLNLTWDKAYGDVSYQLSNFGDKVIKVETYNSGVIETISTINPSDTKTYNTTYDKIIVYGLRDSAVNVKIGLDGYHYFDVVEKSEILLNIDDTSHNALTSSDYNLKVNLITINLSQYMLSDLTETSIEGGKYSVSYFAPIEESGIIVDYDTELTTIEVDGATAQLTNIVCGTKLYFEKLGETYEIVQLLNGNTDITDCDVNANNMYITLPSSGEYDVKVVFDHEYALVNFEINGKNYASAYFTTTTGTDVNSQLVAFAHLITEGYSNSSGYLNTLFSDTTLLTGDASSNVASNIVKTDGVNKIYYTEGDFINLFNYKINENLAKLYYSDESWKNVWFEEFNFTTAYPSGSVTIDGLYVGAGVEEVIFYSTTSTALILSMESELETIDNVVGGVTVSIATAQGGFKLESALESDFNIMGNSEIGYNGHYKNLYLKVKDNATLPKLSVVHDIHTYANASIDFSEKVFSSTDSTGLLTSTVDGLGYDYIHEFKVKQVNLMLESTDKDSDTNYSFEQNFGNTQNASYKVISVNYATTFEQIKQEYGLQDSYTETSEYTFKGFYTSSDIKIDNTANLSWYFENLNSSYFNGQSIYINAVYEKVVEE